MEWFSTYLEAQEERGFSGSFRQYLRLQVSQWIGEVSVAAACSAQLLLAWFANDAPSKQQHAAD